MHGSHDRSDEKRDDTDRSWSVGFFVFPVLVVIALTTLAIVKPVGFTWISDAAQAEFVGMNSPGIVPTETAQPARQIRTVKAY
jgi:hypothetical protein